MPEKYQTSLQKAISCIMHFFKVQITCMSHDNICITSKLPDNITLCLLFSSQIRAHIRWFIEHIAFRAVTLILILVDLSIVIAALSIAPPKFGPADAHSNLSPEVKQTLQRLDIVALVFSCYFMLEVGLRIFAQG